MKFLNTSKWNISSCIPKCGPVCYRLLSLVLGSFNQPALRALRVLRPLKLVTGFTSKCNKETIVISFRERIDEINDFKVTENWSAYFQPFHIHHMNRVNSRSGFELRWQHHKHCRCCCCCCCYLAPMWLFCDFIAVYKCFKVDTARKNENYCLTKEHSVERIYLRRGLFFYSLGIVCCHLANSIKHIAIPLKMHYGGENCEQTKETGHRIVTKIWSIGPCTGHATPLQKIH